MSSQPLPKLTEAEIATIKRLYPTGGGVACEPLMPGRDRKQIVRFAGQLGIRMRPTARKRLNAHAWHENPHIKEDEPQPEPRDPWPCFKPLVTARDWRIW